MKRILAVCIGVLLLAGVLAGCGNKGKGGAEDPSTWLGDPFTCTANIQYGDIAAVAVIDKRSPISCDISFESPAALTGMKFCFEEDTVTANYKGMEVSFNPSSIPGSAITKAIVSAVNSAVKGQGVKVEVVDKTLVVKGDNENGKFELVLDKKSGNLLKLDIPSLNLKADIQNFDFVDKDPQVSSQAPVESSAPESQAAA